MKNNQHTVSVGISAFNEGRNIKRVLKLILSQKQTNFSFKEIFVYSDGGSDNTVQEANSLKNRLIKVYSDGERKGKAYRMGQIFQRASGQLVVMFDGDIDIKDKNLINKLMVPFEDPKVKLVGGNTRPKSPNTFFEKAVYSTFMVFDESRKNIKGGNNLFGCTGACMVMRKEFAKTIKFPKVMTEDDYIYFSCLKAGYKFKHVKDAVVWYKLPTKLPDYLKQVFRSNPEAVLLNFRKYFGKLVDQEYYRPPFFYAKSVFKVFLKRPLPTLSIIAVNTLCIPFFPIISKNYKQSWFTAESTK